MDVQGVKKHAGAMTEAEAAEAVALHGQHSFDEELRQREALSRESHDPITSPVSLEQELIACAILMSVFFVL